MKQTLKHIQTANRNLNQIKRLERPKPNLQAPGNLARKVGNGKRNRRRHYGGAVRDQYGSYLYIPNLVYT